MPQRFFLWNQRQSLNFEVTVGEFQIFVATRAKHSKSQDCLGIKVESDHFEVCLADGVGSFINGGPAAHFVVEEWLNRPAQSGTDHLSEIDRELRDISSEAGTTFLRLHIDTTGNGRIDWIGDSLACGLSKKQRFIIHAHGPVGQKLKAGTMSPKDAVQHPRRNVVDNILGQGEVFVETMELSPSLIRNCDLVLATDGLWDNLLFEDFSKTWPSEWRQAKLRLTEFFNKKQTIGLDRPWKEDDVTVALIRHRDRL